MSVNTLTGYLLLLTEKPHEALDFLVLAERAARQLLERHLEEDRMKSTLPVLEEVEEASINKEPISKEDMR